jgi:hypothetical protein
VTFAELKTDIIVLSCAISAGIHGALVREHFAEGAGAGVGFLVATVLLVALAVVLTYSPTQVALGAAVLVFAGLIASYFLAVTTGVPVLHPDVEAVDGLALFTKAVEIAGLVTAASQIRRPSFALDFMQPKGTTT